MAYLKHDKKDEYDWVMDGISFGFDLGHSGRFPATQSKNLPFSGKDAVKLSKWVVEQQKNGHLLGPFTDKEWPLFFGNVHCSPFGCVPKPPDKIRPILHLSHPRSGISINSEIAESCKAVKYISFQQVVSLVLAVGKNGFLWLCDAKDAYFRCPLKKHDFGKLVFRYRGKIFVFAVLAFGVASACQLYSRFAECIRGAIVEHNLILFPNYGNESSIMNYLDDFFGGHANHAIAQRQFQAVQIMWHALNIPTQPAKCSAPATRQKILGYVYSTVSQTVCVPQDKVSGMIRELLLFQSSEKVTQRQILSLVGKLRWASQAIWTGEAFVRRLEHRANSVARLEHHVRVSSEMRKDLKWWLRVLPSSARGFPLQWIVKDRRQPDVTIWTDASGHIGCGGFTSDGCWFQVRWSEFSEELRKKWLSDILCKELFAVALAVKLWAQNWTGKSVAIWCDNKPVVYILAHSIFYA